MGEPMLVAGQVSIARLHGEACFDCGAVSTTLTPAGTILTTGSDLVWPIVSCGCRSAAPAPRQRPAQAPVSSTRRHCQFCPDPDPDKCIRTRPSADGDDVHIYAHAACAEARGISTLYSFTTPPAKAGEPQ
ncbi:hypothetical protein [Streptomyces zaomyceticus]|uniref:hypothetical protein n=1 Tax=Streptomyces zaomyceticus TaxID=68286 RepID=UPI002E12B539|nr:hypothetical protein OG237_16020 [Streptomyces zaomyceticus]